MPLGMEVGLAQATLLDGAQLPPQKRCTADPHFLAHVHCSHMAASIKMPLGTEEGLGPGDFVLDADHVPPKRGTAAPRLFGPCLSWPNGCPSQQLLISCFMFLHVRCI